MNLSELHHAFWLTLALETGTAARKSPEYARAICTIRG